MMVWVAALLLALVGCDGPSEGPLRSTPATPTKDLGDPGGLGVKWASLEGFVAGPAPAIPEALGGLRIGATEAEARAILAAIHPPNVALPKDIDLHGHRALGAALAAHPDVGVTALVDLERGVVDAIDLTVPADQALYAFTQAWGAPTMQADPELGPVALWTNPETGLRVALLPAEDERAIAKLTQP